MAYPLIGNLAGQEPSLCLPAACLSLQPWAAWCYGPDKPRRHLPSGSSPPAPILQTTAASGASESAFDSVSCTVPTNCVAVGSLGQTLIESWNGSAWSVTPTPKPVNKDASGVSCTSWTSCVAVGDYYNTSANTWQSLSLTGTGPPPTISGFTPPSGTIGSHVTVTGTYLSAATSVSFNGTKAAITTDASTKITATVPTVAKTGLIRVTTPGGQPSAPIRSR